VRTPSAACWRALYSRMRHLALAAAAGRRVSYKEKVAAAGREGRLVCRGSRATQGGPADRLGVRWDITTLASALPDYAGSRKDCHAYRLGPARDAGSVARCSAGPEKRSAPLLPCVCDKATPGWRDCGISPLRPLLRRSTASCTCAHVCGAWPALRATKSCLPRISTSPTSRMSHRNRDVSVLTWGSSSFSIVRILRAHDARVLTPLNNLVCFLSLFRTFGTFGIPPLAARPAMAVPPACKGAG